MIPFLSLGQSFAPDPDEVGTTAIYKDSSVFVAWATVVEINRGYLDIQTPLDGIVSFGLNSDAIGMPTGVDVVSLGDGGTAVVTFNRPITNGLGPDFAVFENGFLDHYIELAFVEVSSNGLDYVRFPAISEEQDTLQIDNFNFSNCAYFYNFAGKYRANYGTPFDLEELSGSALLDVNNITHVKLIDVVGSINPQYGSVDSQGNIINDTYPTAFPSGGFDLDGIGVINEQQLAVSINHLEKIVVVPNPSQGVYSVLTDSRGACVITNSLGQIVRRKSFNETFEIDLTYEESGIYFLHFIDGTKQPVRLIKL